VKQLRLTPALWILAGLLFAVVVLAGVELAKGAAHEPGPKIADPCKPRPPRSGGGLDATVQRIVLDGLDGAACRLHTTREEFVLSLAPETGVRRRWDEHTIEVSLRAGLLRAVDEAEQRGDIPGFAAPFVKRLVESAPLDQLIRGGINLSNLFG
jgi:preprotein translocase subunit Sec61beta